MGRRYDKDCPGGNDCYDGAHLCKIAGKKDLELVRKLVKGALYFCRKCGRAALSPDNLCKPEEL